MWFAFTYDSFETFDTEQEAKREAEKALEFFRDEVSDAGWDEGSEQICWGKVSQKATVVSDRERDDEDLVPEKFARIVEIELTDKGQANKAPIEVMRQMGQAARLHIKAESEATDGD